MDPAILRLILVCTDHIGLFANEGGTLATYKVKVRISDGEIISAPLTRHFEL
jgi:hypothetical protein